MTILHISDDVIVPSEGSFGYVKAVSDGMLLIQSHDGLNDGWYNADEVASLAIAHDPCAVCDGDFSSLEWDERHTHVDGMSDVHAKCCVECKAVTS